MSLHDVVIRLLQNGFPKSETERDDLIAQVEDDRAAQAIKDRPQVVEPEGPLPHSSPEAAPRFDPNTGARIE